MLKGILRAVSIDFKSNTLLIQKVFTSKNDGTMNSMTNSQTNRMENLALNP